MSKRLSPEQLADYRDDRSDAVRELLEHIDAIEAELRDRDTLLRNENENYRRVNQELDEAKAEIVRLKRCT